ncbi:MAG TPA: fibronectin type III domain-containing protein [Candidatus Eisenbacteria bacterium]|nr:fibronectin type III domain-containing protein [Candidatus Eisenbacteria bacterium]
MLARAVATALLFLAAAAPRAASAFPLLAADTPNDGGQSVSLTWTLPATPPAQWTIVRRELPDGAFAPVATIDGTDNSYQDSGDGLKDGARYEYVLTAVPDDPALRSEVSAAVSPSPDWFDMTKQNVAVVLALFFIVLFVYIEQARRGMKWNFRRIPGLDAIEEAIGRATEMGKGVLYVPGVQDIDDIQTIASMILLGQVARTAAKYETPLQVPTNSPAVYTVAEEVVKAGYQDVGRADAYRAEQVRYITSEQFAYVAAVNGTMLRDKPAANLFLGAFFAESLLLAETGHSIGAIQIAGTANVHQMPFFVVACDYTLIGEEYYAASALLSGDSMLLGSLKSSDTVKIVLIIVVVVGCILASAGFTQFGDWWSTTQ